MTLLISKNNRCKRAALIDKDNNLIQYLEEFLINTNAKGNIYIGTVVRIESNLNAAFIDIGMNKLGFLSFSSIHPKYFDIPEKEYNKILKTLEKEHQIKKSSIYQKYKIQNMLHIGQKIMVQITRNQHESKGPMLSSFITIKGKYFKYIPYSISSKLIICDGVEESQINFINSLFKENIKDNGSLSAHYTLDANNKELIKDLNVILHQWNQIKKNKQVNSIIYEEDSFQAFINNSLNKVKAITIEGDVNHKSLGISLNKYPIQNGFNIFRDFEKQINNISEQIVQLSCGGFLIFERTQACTTIDVNMGKNHKKNYRDSILETNLSAVSEIFRQIKLRNIGGIIIIDLIGMKLAEDISKIEDKIHNLINDGDCKIDYTKISKFGIIEICRQYANDNISNYEKCHYCRDGKIKSTYSIAEQIIREIQYSTEENSEIELHCSKEIAEYLFMNAKSDLCAIEDYLSLKIKILIINEMGPNYYQLYYGCNTEWIAEE